MKYNKFSIIGVTCFLFTLAFIFLVTFTDFSCLAVGTYEETINSWCSITHQYSALFFTIVLPIASFISGLISILQIRHKKEKGYLFALLSIIAPLLIFLVALVAISSATS